MLHRSLLLLIAVVCFTGCSSTRTVGTTVDARTSYADVNRAVRGKVVRVSFYEGRDISVTGLHVTPDSLTWVDLRGNRLKSAPTANVRQLSIVKAGRGALVGLVAGVATGAAVGTARAYMQGDDPPSDPVGVPVEEKARAFATAHALYVGLVTTPLGAIIGGRNTFVFEPAAGAPASQFHARKK